jgi:hypothetical protein|nr:MAG TPA: hypothetical protein [Caudoviricetes sp.]
MKLSDIQGDRVFDVIADIIDPIANIAEDKKASAMFRREKLPEGMTAKRFMMQRARKALPVLLKDHKGDIIAILAAIEGVSADAYKDALNLVKLSQDTVELLTDDAFIELFLSAQSENSSGSAQENTGEADE